MATINMKNYSSPRNINLKDGCLRFGATNASTPFDSSSNGLWINASNQLIFSTQGNDTTLGAVGTGTTTLWDTIYANDKTLVINSTTLTLAGSHATNDAVTITQGGSSAGAALQITHSKSTENDIRGTSGTWYVTMEGYAKLVRLDLNDSEQIRFGTGQDCTMDWDGSQLDVSGTVNFEEAVTIASAKSLTIAGTAGTDYLIITAGDVLLSEGSVTLTDDDNAASLSVTNDGATSIGNAADNGVVEIICDTLTSGTLLHLSVTEGTLAGGYYLKCWDETADAAVASIGENGAMVLTGSAAETDVVTLTAGDLTVTSGDIVITAGSLDITENAVDNVALPIVSAAVSVDVVTITADSLTGTESALSISVDALVDGKGIKVENVGETITSGELLTVNNVESGDAAAKTGSLVSITSDIEQTTNSKTQAYDVLAITRVDEVNQATKTLTAQGSVLKLLHTATKTAGTAVTDTVITLEIEQGGETTGTGDLAQFTNVGVGSVSLDVIAAGVGADDVQINASGAHTNGLAALHVKTSGALATGGAGVIIASSGSPTADSRGLEMDVQKDMRAAYIDTDAATHDAIYVTHSGNLGSGKAVMHITDAGDPQQDGSYVGHFAYTGANANESVVLFADGGGKDVTGLYVDCDCVYSAANLSAQITLFSDAAGDLPVLMQFYHSDAGAVDGEYCAKINFFGSDDAPAKELYASIEVEQDDTTAANPDGILWIKGDLAGTNTVSAGFTGNTVMLGAAASTLTTAGDWDLTISTNKTAGNEPRIVMTDGAAGDITITAGATSGEVVLASPLQRESNVGVTADVGSAQGNGAQTVDVIEISTCANSGDAITLPGAEAGKVITVINRGVNSADVFPASGDNINEAGADAAKAVAADASCMFIGIDTTHWEAVTLAR